MVCFAQTVYLSCTDANTISKLTDEIPHEPHHLGVLSGVSKMIFKPVVRSAQTVHHACAKISSISKQTKTSIHLSLLT
jgi:hypothetical protein